MISFRANGRDSPLFIFSFLLFFYPLFSRPFYYVSPSFVHRYSIVSPSFRWTNDGVTMEYRWSNLGEKAKNQGSFYEI